MLTRSQHETPQIVMLSADNGAQTLLPGFIGRLPELFTQHAIDELKVISHAVL